MAGTTNTELKDRLLELEKGVKLIMEQTSEIKTVTTILSRDMTRITEAVENMQRTLRGSNGDLGLVARVDALEQGEKHCQIHLVAKVLQGDEKDAGLVEKVRQLQEFQVTLKRWGFLILGALAVDIATRLLSLIMK